MTIATGILVSKGILYFQLAGPAIRYGTAVLCSYGMFFLLVYFWLRIHFGARREALEESDIDALDVADLADIVPFRTSSEASWHGHEGEFSGGGASSSWGSTKEGAASSAKDPIDVTNVAESFEFDEAIAIVLLVAVFAAVFGSAGYFIYQAPEILLEAAFEVVLTAGLLRRTRQAQSEGWHFSIFKRTWWLFAIVLSVSMAFGFYIKSQCPEASSFAQYRELCWNEDKK